MIRKGIKWGLARLSRDDSGLFSLGIRLFLAIWTQLSSFKVGVSP